MKEKDFLVVWWLRICLVPRAGLILEVGELRSHAVELAKPMCCSCWWVCKQPEESSNCAKKDSHGNMQTKILSTETKSRGSQIEKSEEEVIKLGSQMATGSK